MAFAQPRQSLGGLAFPGRAWERGQCDGPRPLAQAKAGTTIPTHEKSIVAASLVAVYGADELAHYFPRRRSKGA